MSTKLEKLEHNMVKISIEISPEEMDAACEKAYQKNKGQIQLPGFRKGKAPRKMIERVYGKTVFYDDALNDLLEVKYPEAIDELGIEVVSRPEVDVESMEPGQPIVVVITVAVKPEVTLGEYKGLVAEKELVVITEDEVEAELNKEADKNSRLVDVTDRAAEMGDETTIDFEGFVDGVAFDGGKGEDYTLVLGSHSFVDTIEDQIVGKNIGDEFAVNVTVPENYHAELAGKAAVFKVALKKIQKKEMPVLDDDYAKDYSEFETIAEYKESLAAKLKENKQKIADDNRANVLVEAAVANATMEIPEGMIDARVDQEIDRQAQYMQYQGFSLEQYLQMTGSNIAQMRASMRPGVESKIKSELVLEAIAKAENVEVTEEDFVAEMEKMAAMYGMKAEDLMKNVGEAEKANMMESLKPQKAIEILVANAKEA
ncbi:MAG: trigger factor [Firmicutes bacterium]|nr:trigger factor [Bacillota bacterium]